MRNRLIIFDATGAALMGLDGGHGGEHAQAFVRDNLALLAARGITDCIVVDYDPPEGGDAANADIRRIGEQRAELRQRPDGNTEIIGLYSVSGKRAIARTLRVVHAPDHITNTRGAIRVSNSREQLPAPAQALRVARQTEGTP